MATIPMSDVLDHQLLPIDAQDVVTKVRLVIAGNRAGREPSRVHVYGLPSSANETFTGVDYLAWPITYEYEAAEHAIYGATRTVDLPASTDPFLRPDDEGIPEPSLVIGFTNPGSPSAIRDGDPMTYAEFSGGDLATGSIGYENVPGLCGFKLRHSLTFSDTSFTGLFRASVSLVVGPWAVLPNGVTRIDRKFGAVVNIISLPATGSSEHDDLYVVLPPDARNAPENVEGMDPPLEWGGQPVTIQHMVGSINLSVIRPASWRVTHFYPLILNEALLEDIAKSNIRLPASTPRRVTVAGYVAPDRTHTIVGWPGGDYTGVVAQYQYELGRTVIDFEQAGAPVGLPAEAIEAARERRVAIDRAVQDATYAVRMGERQ